MASAFAEAGFIPAVLYEKFVGTQHEVKEGHTMRRSKSEIDLHFIWATYRRMSLVTPEREQAIYACIFQEARRQECEVLALGGMPDHVHLALTMPAKCSPAALMRCIKGVSSTFVRQQLAPGEFFGWQDCYAVFAVCRAHRSTVVSYIHNQKRHHAEKTVQPEWEEVDEESPILSQK